MYETLKRYIEFSPESVAKYPQLTAFVNRIQDLPRIKAYLNSEGFEKIKARYNGKMAKFGWEMAAKY